MLEYKCPQCKTVLNIPEEFIGSTGTCRNCHSSITVEAPSGPEQSEGTPTDAPPTLVAFHIETTGPASRRDSIVEIGAVKIDLQCNSLDTFWNFCNPDGAIPENISERTGITDDMVAAAAFPFEVIGEFFDWVGPRAILFTDHAHYHSKFLSATLLKEDFEPPTAHIIDVVHWAEDLGIPTQEYKLRTLLEALGQPLNPLHRAMDETNGVVALLEHLFKTQAGRLPRQEEKGKWGKFLGKKENGINEERLFDLLWNLANPIEEMCGTNFHERRKFEDRQSVREQTEAESKSKSKSNGDAPRNVTLHVPEWYTERRQVLGSSQDGDSSETPKFTANDGGWTQALVDASQAPTSDEQRKHLLHAVTLGARDPWPYERLTGYYVRAKDYKSAQKICQRYFEGDSWRIPRFSSSSLKLLDRMEKIERRLAGASSSPSSL